MPLIVAYLGLFAWSFLAATVLPGGSEVALAALVRTHQQVALPVLIATIGNYLGACTTYYLGRQAAGMVNKFTQSQPAQSPAARLLQTYGQPALLLAWVPVIGDAVVAVAGALHVPFFSFSCWVILGKAVRYLVIAWAVASLG